ncbi:hypothetical protein, partial [Kitasatospora herbaricolor]|uniref:hypothetical protein n=1 Tax=Kitasatospora herbaricolor TaxID=68217 RepID=UPI0036DF9082
TEPREGEAEEVGGITAIELWSLALPRLYQEVEVDLAINDLIPDLDAAMTSRSWHYLRSCIERLLNLPDSWLWKAVRDGRRSTDLPYPGHRG